MTAEFSKRARALVELRSEGRCEGEFDPRERSKRPRCLRVAEEMHHRRTRGSGGTSDPASSQVSNALALCRNCHHWAGQCFRLAEALGICVYQAHRPDARPVLIRGEWRLLLDDGGLTPLIRVGEDEWRFDALGGHRYPAWLVDGATPLDERYVDVSGPLDANRYATRWAVA
ncbi:hypothetical protein Srot_0038 [Segniliparus rotundus DSM 44985]|uniref:HNH endonuclease n=1 Tax=Segniliparus rotundus (strain ATCC BAA-972 / CDC 1076 / CIP 108378 / DSM 44985 / JCM 13578) TaxID=640132 RepID=D6Z9K4_SEGRD|nr:hypothetical protein [Segniliparus rotundus]ADG96531.1 hypothetical protein Srot_0038 [Segniliparus rotundus DSM 44985]